MKNEDTETLGSAFTDRLDCTRTVRRASFLSGRAPAFAVSSSSGFSGCSRRLQNLFSPPGSHAPHACAEIADLQPLSAIRSLVFLLLAAHRFVAVAVHIAAVLVGSILGRILRSILVYRISVGSVLGSGISPAVLSVFISIGIVIVAVVLSHRKILLVVDCYILIVSDIPENMHHTQESSVFPVFSGSVVRNSKKIVKSL